MPTTSGCIIRWELQILAFLCHRPAQSDEFFLQWACLLSLASALQAARTFPSPPSTIWRIFYSVLAVSASALQAPWTFPSPPSTIWRFFYSTLSSSAQPVHSRLLSRPSGNNDNLSFFLLLHILWVTLCYWPIQHPEAGPGKVGTLFQRYLAHKSIWRQTSNTMFCVLFQQRFVWFA